MPENERQPNTKRDQQGLPGEQGQNGEEQQPTEPTRRKPGEAEGGDPSTAGESREGSQSTGNPNSAG